MIRLVLLVMSMNIALGHYSYTPDISTIYGTVRGELAQSFNNRTYWSFKGIPYAKPPVGSLRFADPVPPDSWNGTLDALERSSECIQRNWLQYENPPVQGSEDCLYLNVYVPQVTDNTTSLPVMVYVPGGGFFSLYGDGRFAHPLYYMDYDIILVTMNYRLGVFGFLSTMDDVSPGNYALKDQVMALKWVQDNIAFFGGSKDNVTLSGESAGSASVHLHMISPLTEGLFTKAIAQSGSGVALWAISNNEEQLSITQAQAQLVNCSEYLENNVELIECLRNVSAEDFLKSGDNFKVFHKFPYQPWTTVTETASDKNVNPYLTKPVLEYLNNGEFKKIPWLVGVMQREGLLVATALLTPNETRADLNATFEASMPGILGLSRATNDTESLFNNISQFYLGGNNVVNKDNSTWLTGFINMLSDRYFIQPVYQAISTHLNQGHDSIYFYNFNYSGQDTYANYFSTMPDQYNEDWGVSHCDDLLYQFWAPIVSEPLSSANDINFSKNWLSLWYNFAVFGEPNPSNNLVLPDIEWKPLVAATNGSMKNDDIRILNVTGTYKTGAKFQITSGFNKDRMDFWENVL